MKRVLTLFAALALTLLAACGSDDDPALSAAEPNDADVTFAQGMIPHHEQAIEMAKLAESKAAAPEVKELARRIEQAQGPEIEQLRTWLRSWGKDESASDGGMDGMDGMAGMDDGGGSDGMGMMSEDEMRSLEGATAAEFDRMFLEMMIRHHEGAIDMARTEVDEGRLNEVKQMAQRIIDAQQAEIGEMRKLLETLATRQ